MKGRLLAAAVLAVVGLAVWRDLRSPVSRSLRAREPVTAFLALRFKGLGGVVPPALYLAVYGRAAGSLELVRILPSTELPLKPGDSHTRTLADVYGAAYLPAADIDGAARAMAEEAHALLQADPTWPRNAAGKVPPGFWLSMELPGQSRPAFSGQLKRELSFRLQKPLFWIDLLRSAQLHPVGAMHPISRYEVFLIAKELRRLEPENIHISRLPVADLVRPFLGGVFRRASGLAEPSAENTVEVYNASDAGGVALRATKILRLREFDVVHFGNARLRPGESLPEHTRFIDRTGRVGGAMEAARALGCQDPEVLTVLEKQPSASISVVIGLDYKNCSRLDP